MLRILMSLLLSAAVFFPTFGYAQEYPEFDGVYLVDNEHNFVELISFNGSGYCCDPGSYTVAFIPLPIDLPIIKMDTFMGIYVQGNYNFNRVELALIDRIRVGNRSALRPASYGIEMRSRAVGDRGYYFEPRNPLNFDSYFIWINSETLWGFILG